MKRFRLFWLLCICCMFSRLSHAVEPESLESQIRELTQTVRDLKLTVENQQREIAILKGQTPPPFTVSAAPSQDRSLQGRWNPDIGVVADVVFTKDSPKADAEGADRLSVRELEIVFGSDVDPYSRLDATISFSDFEAASLEEAYLTRFELPFETTARIGRMKPRIGKALAIHRDSFDTVDEPLVVQRYFGPEGMNRTGVDFTKLLNVRSPMTHQATLGILEGGNSEGGTLFGNSRRRPTLYGRLKNYVDFSDSTNLELGLNGALGSRDEDEAFEVGVIGVDATWIRHLNANQGVKLQGEIFNANREESAVLDEDTNRLNSLDGNVWGGYGLFDFRFHPRWGAGFRYDQVELVNRAVNSRNHYDLGYTGYLTFYQTEFSRWRAQVSHFDLTGGEDDNQILLQGTFAIGEHKHKLQ